MSSHQQKTFHEDADDYEEVVTGCSGCFRGYSCFGWNDVDESHGYLLRGGSTYKESTWLVDKLKKLKEFSEVVAGPKWKNFIRKLGKVCNGKKETQFQYSPESYALNFVGDGDDEEDGELMHSFSSRFATGSSLMNDQQKRTLMNDQQKRTVL